MTIAGELEIDAERGVIYFHVASQELVEQFEAVTVLRICRLPAPIPIDRPLDITHMFGCDWKES